MLYLHINFPMDKTDFIGQIPSMTGYFSSEKYVNFFHYFVCHPVIKYGPSDIFVLYCADFSTLQND